jgi:coenzyme F420-0:L-glutamate ligase/coenzyme F420-1:gamma-L-glutamate ligase
MSARLQIAPVEGLPEIAAGDRLGELIAAALASEGERLMVSDVVVVAQKAVSKAEGRVRRLSEVSPGRRARDLAGELGKDPRLVELILAESREVVLAERGVLIVETLSGWVCANAGIDASNVPGADCVALLPEDPDASARRIRAELEAAAGVRAAVVVTDSFGRPWRLGQTDVAIGCAGLVPLDDWRGRPDAEGAKLAATAIGLADEVAAAADLARSKDERVPACVVRGLERHTGPADGPGAAALRRPEDEDLFRPRPAEPGKLSPGPRPSSGRAGPPR